MLHRPLVALALLLALPAAAAAQPVSHVLQDPADHVVLLAEPAPIVARLCSFVRILPTTQPGDRIVPFEVPSGRLLVVTDVEWEAVGQWDFGPTVEFGKDTTVQLSLELVDPQTFAALPIMRSRALTIGVRATPAAGSEQLTTGIVVAPGMMFCAHAEILGFFAHAETRRDARLGRIILRGYLIDAS
jgi:hypothetical protein